ncbi:YihY/virulence factor BrkB family protein [Methanococcoides orientis]|uniref:YihY/virulence factor BrkB family protein n=1 Tax=Methanococcoides orientis TaxID=2822137 RepID=UPI001E63A815|nr:YihY/virulence factor BrkB family protein [Methanococcoides orientis]UGV41586.1 YihY/virulence factor BrkB family protein [Methanococcoides orientis]
MEKLRGVVVQTIKKWNSDDGLSFSAALSFYLILSLPSLLLFSLSIGGMFLKVERLQATIIEYISPFADEEIINSLNLLFQQLPETSSLTFGLLVSFLLFLWSAGNIFLHFQKTINKMWGVLEYKKGFVRRIFKKRISSFVAVFIFSLLLIMSILAEIFLVVISKILTNIIPFSLDIIQYASSIANVFVLTVLFIYLYKTLPEKKIDIKYIAIGSFLTVFFITIGKYLFSFYLSYSNLTTVYTQIGAFLAIFLWLYYSSMIVTLMTEFIKIYSDIEQQVVVDK